MKRALAFFLASAACLPVMHALAQQPPQGQTLREYMVNDILHDRPLRKVDRDRWDCVNGEEAASLKQAAEALNEKADIDAVDTCVAVLMREARESRLSTFYKELLVKADRPTEGFGDLPKSIGSAAHDNGATLALGGGRVLRLTPGLVFDAGFSAAYLDGIAEPKNIDEAKLRSVADACLEKNGTAQSCFAVGAVYGARAFQADVKR